MRVSFFHELCYAFIMRQQDRSIFRNLDHEHDKEEREQQMDKYKNTEWIDK